MNRIAKLRWGMAGGALALVVAGIAGCGSGPAAATGPRPVPSVSPSGVVLHTWYIGSENGADHFHWESAVDSGTFAAAHGVYQIGESFALTADRAQWRRLDHPPVANGQVPDENPLQ